MAAAVSAPETTIEIRVEEIGQLFNTLDPFPFRERDLDREAEDFIVGWARELPGDKPLRIAVHLPMKEAESEKARELEAAMRSYFTYRADAVGRDLNELFRVGRFSLLIGLGVLALCMILRAELGRSAGFAGILGEGLLILGWVANWRPVEIFLYDWWPLRRRRNLYRRLAGASVALIAHD
jgi:hypothetical protein